MAGTRNRGPSVTRAGTPAAATGTGARTEARATGDSQAYLVPAVETVANVLAFLRGRGQPESLSRICTALGLPRSSGLNIMRTLQHFGLLTQEDVAKQYALGPALIDLGRAAADARGFVSKARPYLQALARDTRLTSCLVQRLPDGHIFLDKVEGRGEVHVSVELGYRYPPLTGAPGKVFMASLPPAEVSRIWAAFPPAPALACFHPQLESYAGELARVRRLGYATALGEFVAGMNAVAAPACAADGTPLAVIVIGPAGILPAALMPALGERLQQIGRAITTDLGGTLPG